MIASNAKEVAKEIEQYKDEVERKLKGMVAMFAHSATVAIQENTPIGDIQSIMDGESGVNKQATSYYNLYVIRNKKYSIDGGDPGDIQVGFHRGAYGYSESGSFEFLPMVIDQNEAADQLMYDVEAYYQIGDTFFIGGKGPGFDAIENGISNQAPDGITGPSMKDIEQIYRLNMKTFYDLAK